MNGKNQENPNITIAREISQKFEFYFIALAFTILGLSVQTASVTKECGQYFFEFFAWGSLLISALAGLSKIEWSSVVYLLYGSLEIEGNHLKEINQDLLKGSHSINENGEEWTDDKLREVKNQSESKISKGKIRVDNIEKWSKVKYKIHKWAFVAGVSSLVISRIILNLNKIFSFPR